MVKVGEIRSNCNPSLLPTHSGMLFYLFLLQVLSFTVTSHTELSTTAQTIAHCQVFLLHYTFYDLLELSGNTITYHVSFVFYCNATDFGRQILSTCLG